MAIAEAGLIRQNGTFNPETLAVSHKIEFDMESVPRTCAEHGLVHPLLDEPGGPGGA